MIECTPNNIASRQFGVMHFADWMHRLSWTTLLNNNPSFTTGDTIIKLQLLVLQVVKVTFALNTLTYPQEI